MSDFNAMSRHRFKNCRNGKKQIYHLQAQTIEI